MTATTSMLHGVGYTLLFGFGFIVAMGFVQSVGVFLDDCFGDWAEGLWYIAVLLSVVGALGGYVVWVAQGGGHA